MPWIDLEEGVARVQIHLAPTDHARRLEILATLAHYDRTMLSHFRLHPAGPGVSYLQAEERGLAGLLQGGMAALVLVLGSLVLVFRHWRSATAVILANSVPLALVLGLMGATGTPWSMDLLPLPVLLIGLAVDDSIHLLWAARGGRALRAWHLRLGARRAGAALLLTSLLLSLSLAVMLLSGLQAIRELGWLIPSGLLLALLCDLTLLPALARRPLRASSWSRR